LLNHYTLLESSIALHHAHDGSDGLSILNKRLRFFSRLKLQDNLSVLRKRIEQLLGFGQRESGMTSHNVNQ